MRTPVILVLAIVSEARRHENDDAVAKGIDVFEHHIKPSGPMGGVPRLGYPRTGLQRPISFHERAKAPFDEASIDSYHQFEPLLYSKPPVFANARDEILFYLKHPELNPDIQQNHNAVSESSMKPNNESHLPAKAIIKDEKDVVPLEIPISALQTSNFSWTTCEEFTEKSYFNLKSKNIIFSPWEPFFVWSQGYFPVSRLHKFEIPSETIVKRYKEKFSKYLKKTIKWDSLMLLMTVTREHLLIAVDQDGSFISLPRQLKPNMKGKKAVFKTIAVRLKMVDSYLAMMFCIESPYYATLMALPKNVPATTEAKTLEAAKLKFRGKGYAVSRGNLTHHKRLRN